MDWRDYVQERPDILAGKPVFKGTRIGVQMVLELLAAGSSEQKLIDAYPALTPEHLRAAYQYAASLIALDETLFVDKAQA